MLGLGMYEVYAYRGLWSVGAHAVLELGSGGWCMGCFKLLEL